MIFQNEKQISCGKLIICGWGWWALMILFSVFFSLTSMPIFLFLWAISVSEWLITFILTLVAIIQKRFD
jgi:hypothetical protein